MPRINKMNNLTSILYGKARPTIRIRKYKTVVRDNGFNHTMVDECFDNVQEVKSFYLQYFNLNDIILIVRVYP